MKPNADIKKIELIELSINELQKIIMDLRDSDNPLDQATKEDAQEMRDNLQEQWVYETGEYWNDFSFDELYDDNDVECENET